MVAKAHSLRPEGPPLEVPINNVSPVKYASGATEEEPRLTPFLYNVIFTSEDESMNNPVVLRVGIPGI